MTKEEAVDLLKYSTVPPSRLTIGLKKFKLEGTYKVKQSLLPSNFEQFKYLDGYAIYEYY